MVNMNTKHLFRLILFTALIIGMSACGGPRKCNGQRGIKTEMGTM